MFKPQVNASVKVKGTGGCVPWDSGGMRSCVAAFVPRSVHEINPSILTHARVSAERVSSHVCGRARSSTTTLAGKCTRQPQPGQLILEQRFCHSNCLFNT